MVTSPTGAAVRDILRILRRRNAGMDVVIVPTPVQGDGADERIARAIEIADRHRLGDVIIVGRGGGSLEDLLPFSSERRRARHRGLADARHLRGRPRDGRHALGPRRRRAGPDSFCRRGDGGRLAGGASRACRGLRGTPWKRASDGRLEKVRLLLVQFAADNLERNVRTFIQPLSQRADYAREELVQEFRDMVTARQHRFALASRELASYSPLAILQRGYAVVTHEPTGRSCSPLNPCRGETPLSIRLARQDPRNRGGNRMPAKSSEARKAPPGFEQRLERLEQLAEKLREGRSRWKRRWPFSRKE